MSDGYRTALGIPTKPLTPEEEEKRRREAALLEPIAPVESISDPYRAALGLEASPMYQRRHGSPKVGEEEQKTLFGTIAAADDPIELINRINTSRYLAETFDIDQQKAFSNLDEVAQYWMGKSTPPAGLFENIRIARASGEANWEIGLLAKQLKDRGGVDAALEAKIADIEARTPQLADIPRPWIQKAVLWAAESAPAMLAAFAQGGTLGFTTGGTAGLMLQANPAGALAAGATGGLSIPAISLAMASVGFVTGTAKASMDYMEGLSYLDQRKKGVPHSIAAPLSTINGIVQGAIETASVVAFLPKIPGIGQALQSATSAAVKRLMASGTLTTVGLRLTSRIAGTATEEGIEEGLQELSDILTEQIARELSKEQGVNVQIDAVTWDGLFDRVGQAIVQGASASLVLGAGNSVVQLRSDVQEQSRLRQSARVIRDQDAYVDLMENATQKPENISRSDYRASLRTVWDQEKAARAAQPQATEQPKAPGDQRTDGSGVLPVPDISSLPPEQRAAAADAYIGQLQTQRDELAKAFEADPVANVAALIQAENALEGARTERQTLETAPAETITTEAKPAPQPWEQTSAEYATAAQRAVSAEPGIAAGQAIELTPEEQSRIAPVREQIAQAFTSFTPEQVDVAALYTTARAEHFGQTIEEYAPAFRAVDPATSPEFAGKRGGYTPGNLQAGVKAVISATKAADVSTYVHELAHGEWGLLEDADRGIVRDYALGLGAAHPDHAAFTAGQMDEETYVQEAYTTAVERYLSDATVPEGRFGEIVKRIGEWIRAVYERITSRLPELTPEMRELLDRHFSVDTQARARTDAGGGTIFQLYSDKPRPMQPFEGERTRRAVDIRIGGVTLTRDQLARIDDRLPDVLESNVRGNNKDALVAALKDLEQDLFAANEETRRQALVAITQNVEATDVADMSVTARGPGTFFQPGAEGHEAQVQDAVERGEWVPEKVLQEYADREWAAQEIAFRTSLREQARVEIETGQVTDAEDWIAMQQAMDMETRPEAYYRNVWTQIEQGGEAVDRAAANQRFLASIGTREAFDSVLGSILDAEADQPILGTKSIHNLLESALQAYAKKGEITEAHYRKLMDQVRDNPVQYRQLFAELLRDEGQVLQLAREAEADPAADEMTKLREANRELRKTNKGLGKKVDSILKQLEGARRAIAFADADTERAQADAAAARETTREVVKTVKETARSVAKDARRELQARAAQRKETERALLEQIALEQAEKEQIIREAERAMATAEKEGRTAEAQARREERDKARGELQAMKEKERARAAAAVEKQRERLRKYRELIRTKQHIDRLVRSILRPPSAAIDYEQAKQIEITQAGLQLRASSAAEAIRRRLEAWYRTHPDVKIPAEAEAILRQRPVRELTVSDLEDIAQRVENLREVGRRIREEKLAAERKVVGDATGGIFRNVTGGKWERATGKGSRETEQVFKGSLKNRIAANTLNMQRLAQALGADGEKWLTREVNAARDAELRAVDAIAEPAKAKMKELGITPAVLAKTVTLDDRTYTHDEIIHMMIALRNDDSASTLRGGNRLTDAQIDRFIANLTPAEKEWGNYMMAQFGGENWTRLERAYIEDTNRGSKKVENYFGIHVKDETGGTMKQEIASDLLSRTGVRPSYAPKKFMTKRMQIREEHRREMRLGATAQFFADIEKQQHYVATWKLGKRLQRIFNDRALREAIAQKYGRDWNKAIEVYINEVANPAVYKTHEPGQKFMDALRGNAVVGALAFNITTFFNQLTGPILYLADAGPIHMMSAVGQWMRNPKELYRFVMERDPQVKHANLEGVREQLKRLDGNGYNQFVKIAGEIGLKPLELIDTWTRVVGWKAVYDKNVGKVGEAEAIRLAQESTLRTQPSGAGKDLPLIYHNNAAKMFLMFSRQLNQIWNMTTWDMPRRAKQGMVLTALADAFALALTGVMIGLISRKRPPEEPEEWIEDLAGQFVAGIPFIGGDLMSGIAGHWWAGKGVNLLPAAAEGAKTVARLFDGDLTAEEKLSSVINVMPDIARTVGLPGVAMGRIMKTAQTGDLWELLGGKEE